MSISIKIHSTNPTAQTCVATVKDNGAIVIDKKNISMKFNLDETANTEFITIVSKLIVKRSRYSNTANSVTVTGHPSPFIGE